MDRIVEESLLYDYYGQLLTERQREVTRLYHEENCSLSEIGEVLGISRQGVHDTLKTARRALASYEEKLGLVARYEETLSAAKEAESSIDGLMAEYGDCGEIAARLARVKEILENIAE